MSYHRVRSQVYQSINHEHSSYNKVNGWLNVIAEYQSDIDTYYYEQSIIEVQIIMLTDMVNGESELYWIRRWLYRRRAGYKLSLGNQTLSNQRVKLWDY